jgi:hypothetical protein
VIPAVALSALDHYGRLRWEIARLTFQSQPGAKLDLIMDNIVHLVLFPEHALGLYRQEYETPMVLGGLTLFSHSIAVVCICYASEDSTSSRFHGT